MIKKYKQTATTYLIGFSWCGPCFWWNLMSSTFSHFEENFFFNFQYFFVNDTRQTDFPSHFEELWTVWKLIWNKNVQQQGSDTLSTKGFLCKIKMVFGCFNNILAAPRSSSRIDSSPLSLLLTERTLLFPKLLGWLCLLCFFSSIHSTAVCVPPPTTATSCCSCRSHRPYWCCCCCLSTLKACWKLFIVCVLLLLAQCTAP